MADEQAEAPAAPNASEEGTTAAPKPEEESTTAAADPEEEGTTAAADPEEEGTTAATDPEEEGTTAAADPEGGLDLDAEQARLDEVEAKIAEGRRALADDEPDGPPVAAGEGAANAPPG